MPDPTFRQSVLNLPVLNIGTMILVKIGRGTGPDRPNRPMTCAPAAPGASGLRRGAVMIQPDDDSTRARVLDLIAEKGPVSAAQLAKIPFSYEIDQ